MHRQSSKSFINKTSHLPRLCSIFHSQRSLANSPHFQAFFVRKLKDFEVLDDIRMGITRAALHVFPNLSIRKELAAGVVERNTTKNTSELEITTRSSHLYKCRSLSAFGVLHEIDSEFVVEFGQELLGPSQFRRVARLSVKKDVSGSSNRISITLATTCLGQVVILKHQNFMTKMSSLQLAKPRFFVGRI